MSTQDLYGSKAGGLEAARVRAEKTLGIELDSRNSSYRGGDYYSKNLENRDEVLLQINNDGEEGGWAEEDYKNFGILLRVYSPDHGDDYKKLLLADKDSGFTLLERSLTTPSGVLRRIRYADGKEETYFEKKIDGI
jgi:hypothetical protein